MEGIGRSLIFPTWEQIVLLNRRHIEETGGEWIGYDNMRNPGSLKWVLDAIQYPLFAVYSYPTLAEKAAILAWVIIDGHVFYDGCKRTGMSALEIFILLNGYQVIASGDEIRNTAIRVAKHVEDGFIYEEFVSWVRSKMSLKTVA